MHTETLCSSNTLLYDIISVDIRSSILYCRLSLLMMALWCWEVK